MNADNKQLMELVMQAAHKRLRANEHLQLLSQIDSTQIDAMAFKMMVAVNHTVDLHSGLNPFTLAGQVGIESMSYLSKLSIRMAEACGEEMGMDRDKAVEALGSAMLKMICLGVVMGSYAALDGDCLVPEEHTADPDLGFDQLTS